MGEQAEKSLPSNKGPELEGADIRDNVENHNDGVEFKPLFDDESVSDDQLKGEDDTAEKPANAEPKVETKPKNDTEKPEDGKEGENGDVDAKTDEKGDKKLDEKEPGKEASEQKKDGASEAKEKQEPDADTSKEKPPAGFVPKEALHQERQITKNLKSEIARLSSELYKATAEKPSDDEVDEFKDFKVLNDAEFGELLENDPDEAAMYQYKFTRYQEHQRKVQRRQMAEKRASDENLRFLRESIDALEDVIPGVTSGKANDVVDKLVDFAVSKGVDPFMLKVITDPRTRLLTADGKQMMVGKHAASIVGFLKGTENSIANIPNEAELTEKIKKDVEERLRPEIEAEVQKTLMEKIQSGSHGFKSLDEIASSGKKDTDPHVGPLTEAEFAKLSPQEQASLLGAG